METAYSFAAIVNALVNVGGLILCVVFAVFLMNLIRNVLGGGYDE